MKIKVIFGLVAVGLIALVCLKWREPGGVKSAIQLAPPRAIVVTSETLPSRSVPLQVTPQHSIAADMTKVPIRVRPVVDTRQEFWSRLAAVHTLAKNLKREEIASLYDFLRAPESGDEKVQGGENVIKNDLLNFLRQQVHPSSELSSLLVEVSADPSQSAVMRSYALQHLRDLYPQLADNNPSQVPNQDQNVIRQAFWNALKDADPTVSGTALLSLHRLSETFPEFDPAQVGATALQFSQDSRCDPLARITALQICGERKLEKALPTALELAAVANNIPLRISAIAAVGKLGGADQTQFLEQLAANEIDRLQGPARAALKELHQRQTN